MTEQEAHAWLESEISAIANNFAGALNDQRTGPLVKTAITYLVRNLRLEQPPLEVICDERNNPPEEVMKGNLSVSIVAAPRIDEVSLRQAIEDAVMFEKSANSRGDDSASTQGTALRPMTFEHGAGDGY